MTVVLLVIGVLVYLSVRGELLAAVDRELGARADALSATLIADPSTALDSGHRFVDPDEAFAQILDPAGRLVDATAGASGSALLSGTQLSQTKSPRFFTPTPTRTGRG